MAQVSWLYLDDNGGKHRVGLYHGDRSGHLVIYCNLKVVQIDFSVLDSKNYSFFIEEDLVEVSLKKEKAGNFSYGFEVNRQVDTPKNRARKIVMKENSWKIAVFFIGGLALVIGGFLGLRAYNRRHWYKKAELQSQTLDGKLSPETQKLLLSNGKATTAKIYFLPDENSSRRAMYAFQTVDNQRIQGKIEVPDTGKIMLPTGFELADKDEFEVMYLPDQPAIHQIRYDLPTDLTKQYYLRAAVREEQLAHPKDGAQRSACIVFTAQNEQGWRVLADFIFQTTPPELNSKNNRDSYLRLVREPKLAEKIKEVCWDQ